MSNVSLSDLYAKAVEIASHSEEKHLIAIGENANITEPLLKKTHQHVVVDYTFATAVSQMDLICDLFGVELGTVEADISNVIWHRVNGLIEAQSKEN